jgi:regulator of protease activity HflC (stomatin/prohibitin superfamily)
MMQAAENEAQAQYVTKTRSADAEAKAKRVVAEAERDIEHLRSEAHAHLARGLVEAGKAMTNNGIPPAYMLYTMWLDAMKGVAASSHGNILSFDGSMEGFERTLKQMTVLGRSAPAAGAE